MKLWRPLVNAFVFHIVSVTLIRQMTQRWSILSSSTDKVKAISNQIPGNNIGILVQRHFRVVRQPLAYYHACSAILSNSNVLPRRFKVDMNVLPFRVEKYFIINNSINESRNICIRVTHAQSVRLPSSWWWTIRTRASRCVPCSCGRRRKRTGKEIRVGLAILIGPLGNMEI